MKINKTLLMIILKKSLENALMLEMIGDTYHHGQGCYTPYPDLKAAELRDLVSYARRNHVRFVWAIHPANTVRWNDNGGLNQLNGLCRKLQQMYDLGVRDFGVLVDDSSGEIGKAERQVQLSNYIMENFIRKHPDVNQTLIMCPTGYNRSWAAFRSGASASRLLMNCWAVGAMFTDSSRK